MKNKVSFCANLIREKSPEFYPQIGLVLGSGLGTFADSVEVISKTSFKELPGFPKAGVGGHAGQLIVGLIGSTKVAVLQGRSHYYEEGKADAMSVAIRTLKEIGCKSLVITNAAGTINQDASPGEIMLITDINTNTLTVTRGYRDTTAATHADDSEIDYFILCRARKTYKYYRNDRC